MQHTSLTDPPVQQRLIAALLDPRRFPHAARTVRLIETHISWVLLAGRYAYKIKKAVNLGFLDFTDLEARRFFCAEEIRLNSRLAPDIYLEVVPIGGHVERPEWGGRPAIEYAVRMRRFASARLMDRLAQSGKVTSRHMDSLAARIARFHGNLPAAAPESAFGTAATIRAVAVLQNFDQLQQYLPGPADRIDVAQLRQATEIEYSACEALFEQRRQSGFVRECHGDLHLGNIVLIGDEPTPFDGIEFNPAMRWIDVMNEIAFLAMDLLHRGRPDLAYRFLNAYLEASGDYAGAATLRFYLAYRATVRAKISAIRASQASTAAALAESQRYLALAGACLVRCSPALIIMHGLPGSGKTTVAQAILEKFGAIRIRSDVERKRLFGLASLDHSRSRIGSDIYSTDATRKTYARLHELARAVLAAGFPVVVDAAFLKYAERELFHGLAVALGTPFVIASVKASESAMRARIERRRADANDASEADPGVLEALMLAREPLLEEERQLAVEFINEGTIGSIAGNHHAWMNFEQRLGTP